MCDRSLTAEDHAAIVAGRRAADVLLERCVGVRLRKAFDLGTPRGLDQAVGELSGLLRARTAASDDAAVGAAVAVLDVDWRRTTPEQRRSLISRALQAAGRRTAAVPQQVRATFGQAADAVVRATRDDSRRRQRLSIGADFNALDRRIVQHLQTSEANFVTDEYGRRHEAFSAEARRIVEAALEAGLGRDDTARGLERAAADVLAGRASFYWDVVAGSFVTRGRSYAQLSAYAEAGIRRYLIEAVLDERTTEICRFLHDKAFEVRAGLGRFEQVEADPTRIKSLTPWVRAARDPESGRTALYVDRDGAREPLALVTRSGAGMKDDLGEFARGRSERDLADLGVTFPPYHGLCRTTTVADVV